MAFLDSIFTFYDHFILSFPVLAQFFISLLILIIIILAIYYLLHHNHWIFLVLLVLFIPGAWPATKTIGNIIWMVVKFLIVRVQMNFPS